MTFDPVAYEDVRKACCALLGDGKGPSRPRVQDLLATTIGRKGSNSIVQGFINQFWADAAEQMNKPARQVADVPDEFVLAIDRALVEMVGVARKMAAEELSARELTLAGQVKNWQDRIQEAHDAANAAEQIRLRSEGELNGMRSIVADLRASIKSLEDKLVEEARKNESLQQTIFEKDAELVRKFAALEAAGQKFDSAVEANRHEVNRLLQQLDDERQSSKREVQKLQKQIDVARAETEVFRRDLAKQREECASMRAEIEAKNGMIGTQATMIDVLKLKLGGAEESLHTAQKEVTVLQVRFETAEVLRKAVEDKCTVQAVEIGELRQCVTGLENENNRLLGEAATRS